MSEQSLHQPFLGRPTTLSSDPRGSDGDLYSSPKKGNKFFSGYNLPLCLLVVGALITLVSSLAAVPLVDYVIHSQVKADVVVDDYSSPSYSSWVSNVGPDGLPITYDVYVFDIANHEDILQGAKPSLTQMGPYRYKETFTRHEVEFNKDGTEVSFYEQWTYNFDADASYPLHDSDEVVQANLVALGLKEMVDDLDLDNKIKPNIDTIVDKLIPVHDQPVKDKIKNETERVLLKNVLHKAVDNVELGPLVTKLAVCLSSGTEGLSLGPFHRKSARDLYFGYKDDEMLTSVKELLPPDMAKTFSTYAPGLSENYTSKEDVMRRDNIMVTYTGKDDLKKLGKFKVYANMTHQYVCLDYTNVCDWVKVQEFDLDNGEIPVCYKFQEEWNETEIQCHGYYPMFNGAEANIIEGTDASQTGEIPFDGEYFQVFISDLYRSSKLKFFSEVNDWNDVTLRRYGIDPADLLNAEHSPGQSDFYQFGYDGLENMTNAAGFPLFASKPHFLDGDPELLKRVRGLSPNHLIHDTYVDVEPITGVAFRVAKRLQLNTLLTNWRLPEWRDWEIQALIERHSNRDDISDIFNCLAANSSWDVSGATYLPFAWADEYYTYSDEDADEFKGTVYGTQNIAQAVALWAGVASVAMCVSLIALLGYRRRVRRAMKESRGSLTAKEVGEEDGDGGWGGRQESSNTITF